MGKPTAPSKVLVASARTLLQPMGLFRKGQSRTWLDDRSWWMGVVEFQPSGWARGSYLNVGCMWLWNPQDYICFDEGGRIEPFAKFRDELEFHHLAYSLAERAALEVGRYRELFPNVHEACAYFQRREAEGLWQSFNAAIAFALDGKGGEARHLFKKVAGIDDQRDWVINAKADARQLGESAGRVDHFRDLIPERIQRCRALQGLASVETIDFDL